MHLGHGQRRSVLILWAWTALLSAFVLYPVLHRSNADATCRSAWPPLGARCCSPCCTRASRQRRREAARRPASDAAATPTSARSTLRVTPVAPSDRLLVCVHKLGPASTWIVHSVDERRRLGTSWTSRSHAHASSDRTASGRRRVGQGMRARRGDRCVFLGVGYLLDRWLGTEPCVHDRARRSSAFVGRSCVTGTGYDARMAEHERAATPHGRRRTSATVRRHGGGGRPSDDDIAFTTRLDGPAPEVDVSKDMVRRGLIVAPVLIAVCGVIWGVDGAWSSRLRHRPRARQLRCSPPGIIAVDRPDLARADDGRRCCSAT